MIKTDKQPGEELRASPECHSFLCAHSRHVGRACHLLGINHVTANRTVLQGSRYEAKYTHPQPNLKYLRKSFGNNVRRYLATLQAVVRGGPVSLLAVLSSPHSTLLLLIFIKTWVFKLSSLILGRVCEAKRKIKDQ